MLSQSEEEERWETGQPGTKVLAGAVERVSHHGSSQPTLIKHRAAEAAADGAKAAGIDIATVYVLGGPSDGSTFLNVSIASDADTSVVSSGKLAFEDLSFPDAKMLADAILDEVSKCTSD